MLASAVVQHESMPDPHQALDAARAVADAVHRAGGRAVVVGGWVRDRLLGRESKDLDMEVFGIAADRLPAVLSTLGRVEPVGQSFPVYKVVGFTSSDVG